MINGTRDTMKNLVIVESPAKAKTIEKYLGKDFKVLSSVGHIRDLATSGPGGLGVDVEQNFTPTYKNATGKSKVIKELQKAAKDAQAIYLATDPDREGEAISWHLSQILGIDEYNFENRVVFNEITKKRVQEAFHHPRPIDMDLVHSQEGRRIVDRILGFKLSGLLRKKTGNRSAGRVQSVALKLIVDREREILAFVPVEYWKLFAHLENGLTAEYEKNSKKLTKEEIEKLYACLTDTKQLRVVRIEEKATKRQSKNPFTTSTLQQEASSKLGFAAKKTMSTAQALYEGIEIGAERTGLITYMRTDSVRLSEEFITATNEFITDTYGKEYAKKYKQVKVSENAQDAHEAIRPSDVMRTPASIKDSLTKDQYRLYELIWHRTVAALMTDAKLMNKTITLEGNEVPFKLRGQTLEFDGYLKTYGMFETISENELPKSISENDMLAVNIFEQTQHFTQPKARYNEASLVKIMEELGIGRPSTYSTIMDTLKERKYVTYDEKRFAPTEQGFEVTDRLQEFFQDFINVDYTASLEGELDEIASGNEEWTQVLQKFYDYFMPMFEKANGEMVKEVKYVGRKCPDCGHELIYKRGRYGEFIGCENYPECKHIESLAEVIMQCPKCTEGNVVERKTKRGKVFYGCDNYPKCDFASWDRPLEEPCPTCGKVLVQKGKEIKCMECDYKRAVEK